MSEIVQPRQMVEQGFRYVDIYPYTLRLLSMAHSRIPTVPPPRTHPRCFDEIYSQRDNLAAFKVSLGRGEEDQVAYYALLRQVDTPDQMVLDKYFNGTVSENDNRSTIVSDDYPARMPEDASHFLLWYTGQFNIVPLIL